MAASTSSPAPKLLIHVEPKELQAADWQDAIMQLAAVFARQAGVSSAQSLVASAMERETSEPTYLGKGMALPHARVPGLPCAGICVAHSVAGISWHEERAHLIIFVAVPEEAPELYLQLMSRLVRWRLRLPESALTQELLPAREWEAGLNALLVC